MIKLHYSPDHIAWSMIQYEVGQNGDWYVRTPNRETIVVKQGEAIPQDAMFWIDDLAELALAIADAKFKAPSDHKLEGILQATQYHLEDMRKLVMKGKR